MGQRVIIIDEKIFQDIEEVLEYMLEAEQEYFCDSVDHLVPAAGHTKQELDKVLADYEASNFDDEHMDEAAAISDGHILCNTIRVWRELHKYK